MNKPVLPFRLRRAACSLLAGCLLAAPLAAGAKEEAWPSKPIRIIVAFAPGGLTDIIARTLQPQLSEAFGQPVIIENRPAAGGTIAEGALARSEPDGYTLLMTADGVPANPHLYKGLSYDMFRDLQPVSQLVRIPLALLVNPALPVKSVKELVAFAAAAPGKYSYASPGAGTSNHLFFEVFKDMTRIDMVHAPYKGGSPAMTDLVGGHVQALLISGTLAAPQVQGGKVRALAVTSSKRVESMPDVPTFAEAGYPEFNPHQWTGLFVPAGTRPDVVARIHAAFSKATRAPDVVARLKELSAEPIMTSPEEFKRNLKKDYDMLGALIESKGITR
ncbi:MAG: tripartite tricarboxylate transporter substrate binding protein [Pigmentiphaga sp.]|uniref:Bug family tripartite tricarboxylate transporter substrate binding protein n=1 Tax=Pigmentiphaga sp. TaxID=1977564 RepID=UPI0029B71C26|nr:tripartite tricarboxylate transporter substrate binding protein [Pigmentiphaga sp.]MDX3906129.1 tripartite tricarboxylate transporter substrate binding protein [Pigmentiphaga sp.]